MERRRHRQPHAAELLQLPVLRRVRARGRTRLLQLHGGAWRGAAAPGGGPGALAAFQVGDGADGMTFGRLLYTDCQVGTGRGAGGGFQIQAQSEGVDSAQARMAVGWLLYEVQNAW